MSDSALEELDRIESNFRLHDPETGPAEVARIVEEELRTAGLKPIATRKTNIAHNEALRKRIFDAAAKFVKSRPETDPVNGFLPSQANEKVLHDFMDENSLDFTSVYSYEQAFLAMRDRLTPTPRREATQVRVRKVDGIEISHEALDRLSAKDFDRLLQNPRAVEAINALPPRNR
jgi:hypothetical protein